MSSYMHKAFRLTTRRCSFDVVPRRCRQPSVTVRFCVHKFSSKHKLHCSLVYAILPRFPLSFGFHIFSPRVWNLIKTRLPTNREKTQNWSYTSLPHRSRPLSSKSNEEEETLPQNSIAVIRFTVLYSAVLWSSSFFFKLERSHNRRKIAGFPFRW